MGTSLTGLTPATTYDALIKVGDNGPIDATLKVLSDGLGNNLPMEASSTTINFTNGLQQSGVAVPTASQVNAKQDTLVSGTNIKTINGTTILGSGNIVTPTTSPSGVSGAIQFSNGSAFASDASNFFWDDTNKRLGVRTNSPSATTHIKGVGTTNATTSFLVQNSAGSAILTITDDRSATFSGLGVYSSIGNFQNIRDISSNFNILSLNNATGDGTFNQKLGVGVTPTARVHIQGSGSTSATTSLLVQNSAGLTGLSVLDNRDVSIGTRLLLNGTFDYLSVPSSVVQLNAYHGLQIFRGTGVTSTMFEVFDNATTTGGLLVNVKNTAFANMLCVNYLGQMAMGTASPNASAQMQIDSTTRGFACPRMTTTQKNAIASPLAGLQVYDTTTNKLCCYNGSTWNDLF